MYTGNKITPIITKSMYKRNFACSLFNITGGTKLHVKDLFDTCTENYTYDVTNKYNSPSD